LYVDKHGLVSNEITKQSPQLFIYDKTANITILDITLRK